MVHASFNFFHFLELFHGGIPYSFRLLICRPHVDLPQDRAFFLPPFLRRFQFPHASHLEMQHFSHLDDGTWDNAGPLSSPLQHLNRRGWAFAVFLSCNGMKLLDSFFVFFFFPNVASSPCVVLLHFLCLVSSSCASVFPAKHFLFTPLPLFSPAQRDLEYCNFSCFVCSLFWDTHSFLSLFFN